MLTIVDIGISNINSVSRALTVLRVSHRRTSDPAEVLSASRLVLPGVGSFREASTRLARAGLRDAIREAVLDRRVPILGICLGMQLLAEQGDEGGDSPGLGLVAGRVTRMGTTLPLPHIGWNDVTTDEMPLLRGLDAGTCFYFVHSYHLVLAEKIPTAWCDYGGRFVAAVQKGHIGGTQFHPEKSQAKGLELLRRFTAPA